MSSITVFYSMVFDEYEGKYYCVGAFGRFLDEVSKYFDTIYLYVPVRRSNRRVDDYCISSPNIVVRPMPPYHSILSSLKYTFPSLRLLAKYSREWDRAYIRYPSPFSLAVFLLARLRHLPVYIHLVGDTRKVVELGSKYKGLARLAGRMYALMAEATLGWMIRHSTATFVNGSDMRHVYRGAEGHVREIRTSTFYKNEIFHREDTCRDDELRLLYVGFLRHEKGLEYLIDALPTVEKAIGKTVRLDLVGKGDMEDLLRLRVEDRGLEGRVRFLGYVPMGESLSKVYRAADIFVLPSVSEGTPRVLLEAMSNGVPVIATKVGGIPFTVQDGTNGRLVEPLDSAALARAIIEVAQDTSFRRNLIQQGYSTASTNTLESHVLELYTTMQTKERTE